MGASDITIFAAFAAFFAALLIGSAMIAAPIRRKMVALGNDLYRHPKGSDDLKERIDFLLDTATSPWVAVLLIAAAVATFIDDVFFNELEDDPESYAEIQGYQELVSLYFQSVLLANPLAALFFLPLVLVCVIAHLGMRSIRTERIAEAQIDRVSHSRLAKA